MPDTMIQSPISSTGMPVEISRAIGEVMAKIKSLPKGERNEHGHYNFASIDDFLAAVGPLCSAAGLIVYQDEDAVDVIDRSGKAWLKITYAFSLGHISGAFWDRPMKRTVFQTISGPQTTGSVQSYALKQFMRSMFLIPTGERDGPDYCAKEDMPAQVQQPRQEPQERPKTNKRPTPTKPTPAASPAASEADDEQPAYMAIPIGSNGPLFGRWTKSALETLAGKPEEWRRYWLELHEIELAEMRASRPDYADRVVSAAISPDLPVEAA
jgi:hypothetical protein